MTSELSQTEIQDLQHLIQLDIDKLKLQLSINAEATAPVQLDQTSVGRLSRIDAIQQQHMASSTRQLAQERLKRLIRALNAIKENDYGYCQHCDQGIAVKRLQVQPEAALCLSCQQLKDQS